MRHRMLTLIAALGLMAAVAPTPAAAQAMPNYGAWLNSMVGMQQNLYNQSVAQSYAAASAYYQNALRLRAMGYTGQIPTGLEDPSVTNARLQNAYSNYVTNTNLNMQRTWNAIGNTNAAITRGCQTFYVNGGAYRICP